MEQTIQTMLADIATIKARQETDHGKIKEIKDIISPIQKLAVSVDHLTTQMERQNANIDKFVESAKESARIQGERLGELEKNGERLSLMIERYDERVSELEKKVEEMRAKGGKRWESVIEKTVMVLVAALMGYLLVHVGILT